jgi:DHA1 family bicyclomycin/chloramphenicol resistance-like MFS transporter
MENTIKNDIKKDNSKFFLLITLSAMTAFAPLITDMYLPSLPAITEFFNTSVSMVQLTISTSMFGIAIGQLFFGPISDKTGRRKPLFASFILFLLATIGCILSSSIHMLITFRLLQGLGAAGSIVTARSVAADKFSGKELLKFLALITAVQGVAPIVAPVIGSVLLLFTNWKGIFIFLGILGLLIFIIATYLKESLPFEKRAKVSVISTFKLFAPVLKNKPLMLYIALLSFAQAVMFAYIASSPFIFQEHYGISPMAYSIIFAANAVALALGNLIAARFDNPKKVLKIAICGLLVFCLMTSTTLLLNTAIAWFCAALFLTLLCAGAIFPITTNLALDLEQRYKGTASAVLGASSFLLGGIAMPLAGLGNILNATAFVMSGCAIITIILLCIVNKKK